MTAEETTMALTLLATAMARKMSEQELVQTASLLTQLGATLGFLASQRALENTGQGGTSVPTTDSDQSAGSSSSKVR